MTAHNVGRFLGRVTPQLLADSAIEPNRPVSGPLDAAWRKSGQVDEAARQRREAIRYIEGCNGFLDHARLYAQGSEVVAVVSHPYSISTDDLDRIEWFRSTFGLSVTIDERSGYFPGRTVKVTLFRSSPENS